MRGIQHFVFSLFSRIIYDRLHPTQKIGRTPQKGFGKYINEINLVLLASWERFPSTWIFLTPKWRCWFQHFFVGYNSAAEPWMFWDLPFWLMFWRHRIQKTKHFGFLFCPCTQFKRDFYGRPGVGSIAKLLSFSEEFSWNKSTAKVFILANELTVAAIFLQKMLFIWSNVEMKATKRRGAPPNQQSPVTDGTAKLISLHSSAHHHKKPGKGKGHKFKWKAVEINFYWSKLLDWRLAFLTGNSLGKYWLRPE